MPNLQAKKEFQELGGWLANEGIDGFLVETMNNLDEAQACLENIIQFRLPIWIGFNLMNSTIPKILNKIGFGNTFDKKSLTSLSLNGLL